MQVVVAGVGNVLRGDDGFGVRVAERLLEADVPAGVRVLEVGIGGIHLVQELYDGCDALVVVDAVDAGRAPGTVLVITPDVLDVTAMTPAERHDQLADMHYTTPERAFMLARALGVLPAHTYVVGCQVADSEPRGQPLTAAVAAAVDVAAGEVRRLVTSLGVRWEEEAARPPGAGRSAG